MAEEKGINDLSSDVLAVIFRDVVVSSAGRLDRCKDCAKPYYWIIREQQACWLRAVCQRWRSIMLHRVLITSLCKDSAFCFTPMQCHEGIKRYNRLKMERCNNPLNRGPPAYIPFLIASSTEEEDDTV